MLKTICDSPAAAVADIPDGATIMIGGFTEAGKPNGLILALRDHGARDLTVIMNAIGRGDGNPDLLSLLERGLIRRIVCSFFGPIGKSNTFSELLAAGKVEAELVPQGTFAERIRAGGVGVPAFFTPTGAGTPLAEGKETRVFNGRECLLETALTADFALIHAERADRLGNLEYWRTGRNFNPAMAAAAGVTIVEAREIVEVGAIDPERVGTPGIHVQRIVRATLPKGVRR